MMTNFIRNVLKSEGEELNCQPKILTDLGDDLITSQVIERAVAAFMDVKTGDSNFPFL